ncbi:S-adenosyl-L-methionine-dependent methyltransferase [Coniochaeta sp. 2T2.1]|nr:S-adenosyl-L-methionine-dependent methyltransferase [Coniochaeta sp. 2T2.1]
MPPPPPPPKNNPKLVPSLHGSPKTLLVTLYSRWLDCQSSHPPPLLNDRWAGYVIDQIDYDWREMGINGFFAAHMTLRARIIDQWATEWLNAHKGEDVTVLHLACGLDARCHRLSNWGRGVRWVDVDLPEVVELRRRLLPAPEGGKGFEYKLFAGDVTDDGVLEQVASDRPTLVIFEGLMPYLEPGDADGLIKRLCERYGGTRPGQNQLLFDGAGWVMLAVQRWTAVFKGATFLKRSGTGWKSSIDDPKRIEGLASGLRLVEDVIGGEARGVEEMSGPFRLLSWALSWVPGVRYLTRYLRYAF